MEQTGIFTTASPGSRPSLSDTVGALCKDMLRMRNELHEAHREISRLKARLARRDSQLAESHRPNLRSLRRQISFHCHPDRGGDQRLMQRVNALFDCLEDTPELLAKVA